LTEGHELTEEQLWAVDLLQRAERQGIQLFVTAGTVNILSQLASVHAAVVAVFLDRVETLQPTRYFKRWARRLRAFNFAREDAYVLALACFGTTYGMNTLGMHVVATYDQAMINNWSVQRSKIEKRFQAMRRNLRSPYNQILLPNVLRPEEILSCGVNVNDA
jgi:hypothetical protein